MSSKQKAALDSDGVSEVFKPPTEKLFILEENPKHPNHHEHMLRVAPDDPDNVAMVESFIAHGWIKTETIAVFLDGDRYAVSNGRRSLTNLRRANVILKAKRDPRYPLRPRVIIDDDPALTETIANSMRKDDPPMVKARRFVQLRETIGAAKAAAALGLSTKDANDLTAVLANPSAELQKAVNERRIPSDTAARAASKGSAAVAKVIAAAKGADGKIDPAKAVAAVKDVVPVVHRSTPHPKTAAKIAGQLATVVRGAKADGFLLAMMWQSGVDVWDRLPAEVQAAMVDHGWGPERRAAKGGAT